jgi:hypothetical protein
MIDSEGGAFGFDCYLASPEFRVFQQPARCQTANSGEWRVSTVEIRPKPVLFVGKRVNRVGSPATSSATKGNVASPARTQIAPSVTRVISDKPMTAEEWSKRYVTPH